MMTIERIEKTDLLRLARLPAAEEVMLSDSFATIGKQDLLTTRKTALFCSRQCPGEVILRLFDLARRLRTSDLTFIGGFHTPAERDFLHHLLPGSCRLIVCPARRLEGMRVPAAWQKAIAAERMLLLSPFTVESQRRQSARLAERRNELVVALADQILLLHAAPNSHTERLLSTAQQKPMLTLMLDDETLCHQLNQA
jgi:predicted Rossmann fold nucleotide-binding protein DprA/Smf involved in DNA uptake